MSKTFKSKAFAEDKFYVAKMLKYISDNRTLQENAANLPFFFLSAMLSKTFFKIPVLCNSLLNDKILDQSKFNTFADDRINVTKKLKFV